MVLKEKADPVTMLSLQLALAGINYSGILTHSLPGVKVSVESISASVKPDREFLKTRDKLVMKENSPEQIFDIDEISIF